MFAALPAQKSKDHVHMWLEILRFFWIAGVPPIALGVEAVEILLEPPAEPCGHLA